MKEGVKDGNKKPRSNHNSYVFSAANPIYQSFKIGKSLFSPTYYSPLTSICYSNIYFNKSKKQMGEGFKSLTFATEIQN